MMRTEVVERRGWVTEAEFLELLGVTNLIPGPNSTQLAIHLGYRRAGKVGLILAGLCFVAPAMLIVLFLAWIYRTYGSIPSALGLLRGMKAVVVAIVLQAVMSLAKSSLKTPVAWVTATVVTLLSAFSFVSQIVLVFVPGLVSGAYTYTQSREKIAWKRIAWSVALVFGFVALAWGIGFALQPTSGPSTLSVFWDFLRIGSVLYGSGYVLISYLNSDLVSKFHWLGSSQMLDAISVGQFTPGPVFTTATFIGFVLGGVPGALVATLGIFLPSFFFVPASAKWLALAKESATAKAFLASVQASSLGLMAAALFSIGRTSLLDVWTILIASISWVVLMKTKVNSAWLVAIGAVIGLAIYR